MGRIILCRMALAAYGLLISTQFGFAGTSMTCSPSCTIGGGPPVLSVAEPATIAMLATGVGILALARFRKRR